MDRVIKKTVYHHQVYEIVKRQILSGQLVSGQRIHENSVAQALGVSRSPVREAMRMLEQDQLLLSTPAGLVVNPLDAETVLEIYECRMLLESYAASQGVDTLSDADIEQLEQYVRLSMQYHAQKDLTRVIESNTRFHEMLNNCCGNDMLRRIMQRNHDLSLLARTQEFACYNRGDSYLQEHMAVVDALKQRSASLVEERMREHIRNDCKFYVDMSRKAARSSDQTSN